MKSVSGFCFILHNTIPVLSQTRSELYITLLFNFLVQKSGTGIDLTAAASVRIWKKCVWCMFLKPQLVTLQGTFLHWNQG